MRKTLLLFLSICFLSQGIAFAKEPAPSQTKSLAEYRNQVKIILAQKPWIKQYGIFFLTTAGITTGALVLQKWHFAKKAKQAEEQRIIREIAQRDLMNELISTKSALSAAERKNVDFSSRLDKAIREAHYNGEIAKHNGIAATEWKEYAKNLEKTNSKLSSRLYDLDFNFSITNELNEANHIAQGFSQKLSMGKELTETDLKIILEGTDPEVAGKILQNLKRAHQSPELFLENAFTFAKTYPSKVSYRTLHYLRQMLKKYKGVALFTVILAGATNIYEAKAQAQQWESRLNKNFQLFAEASDEELEELERLGLGDLCREGAEAIISMSNMSEEEKAEIIEFQQHHQQKQQVKKITFNY